MQTPSSESADDLVTGSFALYEPAFGTVRHPEVDTLCALYEYAAGKHT